MAKQIRINDANDLRRFLVSQLNRWNRGEINDTQLKAGAYVGQILKGVIEASDIETRILELEERLKERSYQ